MGNDHHAKVSGNANRGFRIPITTEDPSESGADDGSLEFESKKSLEFESKKSRSEGNGVSGHPPGFESKNANFESKNVESNASADCDG
jgi:hypothetical protein